MTRAAAVAPVAPVTQSEAFEAVLMRRLSRRDVLSGGVNMSSVAVLSSLGLVGCSDDETATLAAMEASSAPALGFAAIGKSESDQVVVPAGYTARVLYATGDPIKAGIAAYVNDGSDIDSDKRAGDHHDGMSFFGLDADGDWDKSVSDRGLIAINHENICQFYLHPNGPSYSEASTGSNADGIALYNPTNARTVPDEVRKEINAHGVAILEVRKTAGAWGVVQTSALNRRITPYTPMEFSGPARGNDYLKTAYDPEGLTTRGTINNCANGYTPWGTYLTCEENWAFYFRKAVAANTDLSATQIASNTRYSVGNYSTQERKFWANTAGGTGSEFTRFLVDATAGGSDVTADFRQEPNCFGWVVEIDPFDPLSTPVKHTALGRFAHEGAWIAPAVTGEPIVVYMGDDSRNEYIYKFVSDAAWDPKDRGTAAGLKYLGSGTLYAAKFNDDGTGTWLELTHNMNGLNAFNVFPFFNQGDVVTHARIAADKVGATKMDRPEWGAVNPLNHEVYVTLTNNRTSNRPVASLDAANPRAYVDDRDGTDTLPANRPGNVNGHIIRWREEGVQDAVSFRWDIFVFGAQQVPNGTTAGATSPNVSNLTDLNDFSSPDGLWFDDRGVLWIQTDDGSYTDVTNCMMLAARPGSVGDGSTKSITSIVSGATKTVTTFAGRELGNADLRRFLVGPKEAEITGICMTPDGKTMFVNIQHPGERIDEKTPAAVADTTLYGSHWPLDYPTSTDAEANANGGAGAAGARPRSATLVITKDDGGVVGL